MIQSNNLARDVGIMLIATAIANISLLIFHIFMSRSLGPANYGILVSLLSILFIFFLPLSTIQIVVAKYVSSFKIHNHPDKIRVLFIHLLKNILLYSVLAVGIFVLGRGYIGSFLQIPSKIPVILLGVALSFSLVLPLGRGTLQGIQKFGHLGINILLEPVCRLLLGFFLVWLGLGVAGAMGGFCLGSLIAVLAVFIPLRFLCKLKQSDADRVEFTEIYHYFWPVFLALFCFAVLTNMDVIFVKHFFSPLEAGYYSVLVIVGRGFLSVTLAVSMAMFPKVSELHELNRESSSTLGKSLLICTLVSCGGIFICIFFPRLVILVVFGQKYLAISPLIRIFGIAITPLSLTYIFINYNLAKHRTNFLYSLIFGVIFYIVMLSLFHSSLLQIILVLGTTGTLMLVLNASLVFVQTRRDNLLVRVGGDKMSERGQREQSISD